MQYHYSRDKDGEVDCCGSGAHSHPPPPHCQDATESIEKGHGMSVSLKNQAMEGKGVCVARERITISCSPPCHHRSTSLESK